MKEVELSSFKEFLAEYKSFFPNKEPDHTYFSDILFRGQSEYRFKLNSTLERYTGLTEVPVSRYIRMLLECQPEFTSYTPHRFDFDVSIIIENVNSWSKLTNIEGMMSFAVHLRHVGFPSPLIDWTRSPYVAAYFAYCNAQEDDDLAIFGFLEWAGKGKTWSSDEPHIIGAGPYLRTSERHHIQQAEYTSCIVKRDEKEYFANHELALQSCRGEQDILIKFKLPASERKGVIRMLNSMNINAYTLFRNEEGLAKLLSSKYFL